ncbi:MAG: VWA domain-containing protein [Phycisphaerales bacterium]|nr:VWA domain-containing protein [Phycisphaerales bacterium]
MEYYYGQFNGQQFPTGDKLFISGGLADFILEYGDQALRALEEMLKNPKNADQEQLLQRLLDEGLLDKDGQGRLRLTPRAITHMQHKALMEIFADLRRGQREGHQRVTPGWGGERIEGTKPYEFGDPVSELDVNATLRNALSRVATQTMKQAAQAWSDSAPWPGQSQPNQAKIAPANQPVKSPPLSGGAIKFHERDFELHQHEGTTSCSTVVLLDMSGSMMRHGRFASAKRVALAMQALVRSRFSQDTIDFVGFYSGAKHIAESQLPLAMPKPVTVHDYQVRTKVPIDQLANAPQHFTNLHMGLQLARRILRRRGGENKQIFIITDGQPTAHVEGDMVYLLYPPDPRSTVATLKEAAMAVREGCRFSTFALIEDYWGMEWVGFVDQLARLTRGISFYTSSGDLASCVMESYLSGRKKKSYIA